MTNTEIVDPFDSSSIVDPFEKKGTIVDPFETTVKAPSKTKQITSEIVENPFSLIPESAKSAWNVLGVPLVATGGAAGAAVAQAASGDVEGVPEALTSYFTKVAEKVHLPQNKTGEFITSVLSLPFELIQQVGKGMADPVVDKMVEAGFKPEVAAATGAAIQGLVNFAGVPLAAKGLGKLGGKKGPALSELEQELLAKEASPIVPKQRGVPEQTELGLEGMNKFGARPSEFALDENGIPINKELSLEAQTSARFGKDLFADKEVEQAVQQLKETPVEIEKATVLGGVGKKGFEQGGAINLFGERPKTLEQKAKVLSKEEWTKLYIDQNPDKARIAGDLYDRLNPIPSKVVPISDLRKAISENPVLKGLDVGLGIVSTRIKNISEPIHTRANMFEMNLLKRTHEKLSGGDRFFTLLNELPKEIKAKFDSALLNNDTAEIRKLSDTLKQPEIFEQYKEVRKTLRETGEEHVATGRLEGLREEYFPRIVKDVEGLLESLGSKHRTELEARLYKAQKVDPNLSELDKSAIVNSYLKNRVYVGKPGYAKERKLDTVPEELQKFYYSPTETFHSYIRKSVKDIETAKFFGKDLTKDPVTGKPDIDSSIGSLVLHQLEDGKITGKQAAELESILKSRFGPGNQSSNAFVQTVRDSAHLGLLGDFISALTQGGDLAVSIYLNGLRSSVSAAVKQATKTSQLKPKDFGFMDHISEEFISQRATTKTVNLVHKTTSFSLLDMYSKGNILNASLIRAQHLSKTSAGQSKLAEQWKEGFGEDFPQLIKDLQSGKPTELTDLLAFSQVAKVQPISRMEVTQAYLNNPNARILYTLKSFALKQGDILRRDSYNEIKKGNVKKGLSNLARYITILGISGATIGQVKDWILGRDSSLEASDVPLNVLKTFGYSDYVAEQAKKGNVVATARDIVLPPYKMYDDIIKDVMAAYKDDPLHPPTWKSVRYLPWFGKYLYNTEFGGAEKANKAEQERKFKELTE